MAPKKYGDKQFLDVVKRDIPKKLADDASTEELAEAMAVLRARGELQWPPDFHSENMRRSRQ